VTSLRGKKLSGAEADPWAPEVPYDVFYSRLAAGPDGFKQGDHVTILGPTKSGKTTLALDVVEIRSYVLGIFTKPEDPLLDDVRRRGWRYTHKLDIQVQDGVVQDRRVAYHPVYRSGTIRQKEQRQAVAVQAAADYVFDAGKWCVFVDEGVWVTQHLGLARELQAFWYQGRTSDISLVLLAQRPAWVPRAAYSQAEHVFFFHTSDREDQKRFADLGGGVDTDAVRALVAGLARHEFLYVAPHEGTLLRSKVQLGAATEYQRTEVPPHYPADVK
jgi:hypothetical protein